MKKLMAVVLGVIVGLMLFAACSGEDAQSSFAQKSYTADAAQVQAIEINVIDRKIEIEPSTDGQIKVDYSESDKEAYDVALDGGTLSIACKNSKEWSDYIGTKPAAEDRTIRLYIPEGVLSSLDIVTTNEDIALPAMVLKDSLHVDVNNGSINLERLDVGSAVSLSAKNGSVTGTIVGGYDDFTVTSNIKKGESNLPEQAGNGTKTLDVSVNNGDIALQLEK